MENYTAANTNTLLSFESIGLPAGFFSDDSAIGTLRLRWQCVFAMRFCNGFAMGLRAVSRWIQVAD